MTPVIRRSLIIVSIITLPLSAWYALSLAGVDTLTAITEARCRSGAFLTHSDNVHAVEADASNTSAPSGTSTSREATSSIRLTGNNLVPNPTLQGGAVPTSWLTNIYGQNKATFTTVPGQNSTNAVRVDIAQYTNGAADWYYPAITVKPGQNYQFSDYYESNVATRPVLMLQDASGHQSYINLPLAAPAATWTRYSADFLTNPDTVKTVVFHPLATKGYLQTYNYSLVPSQSTGFHRALVSLTFDDGWRSIHDNALPLMKRYHVVSTQYLIAGYLGMDRAYMKAGDVYDFRNAGHEIASHTVDHTDLTKLSPVELAYQLGRSSQNLGKCFAIPTDFAAPYGTYNSTTTAASAKVYATARSTDTGYNTANNLNPYQLKVQNMAADTTPQELQSWLQAAARNHLWLILVYHQIDTHSGQYARAPQDFERDLQAVTASGLTIKTVQAAYDEIRPQLK